MGGVKMRRTQIVHHDRYKFTDPDGFLIAISWCGRQSILPNEKDPITPEEEKRLDRQALKNADRPLKHCQKCVKAKKAVIPGYQPPDLGNLNQNRGATDRTAQ